MWAQGFRAHKARLRRAGNLAVTPGGHSESERMVYTWYGDKGPRPRLLSGVKFSLIKGYSNYALVGLDFYADQRDPNSPTYEGPDVPGVMSPEPERSTRPFESSRPPLMWYVLLRLDGSSDRTWFHIH